MLVIDGSYGEGGGQIVRTSVALSSLTLIPVKVKNIRAKRKPPGLKMQHYTALKFLEKVTKAKAYGIEVGSKEIYFEPRCIEGGTYNVDIKTAGSITLLLQASLLPLLFANKITEVYIRGGTDVKHSPTVDYFRFVIIPYLRRFAEIEFEVRRRGFYPKGGGLVYLRIKPKIKRDKYKSFEEFLREVRKLESFKLDKITKVKEVFIYSFASEDLRHRKVAERQAESAKEVIENVLGIEPITETGYVKTLSTGSTITIVGVREDNTVFGADGLGERGKPSEKVGKEVGLKFLRYSIKGSIDNHLADNLIPYLGLVGGSIKTDEFTNHLLTNIWVVEKFFGKIFEVDEKEKIVSVKYEIT